MDLLQKELGLLKKLSKINTDINPPHQGCTISKKSPRTAGTDINPPHQECISKKSFTRTKGCLYRNVETLFVDNILQSMNVEIPKQWNENRINRDGQDYHITVVSSKHYKKIKAVPASDIFYVLGYVKLSDVAFLVCHYPSGVEFCKEHNVPVGDFHITLGFKEVDNHSIRKDYTMIIPKYVYVKDVLRLQTEFKSLLTDHCNYLNSVGDFVNLKEILTEMMNIPELRDSSMYALINSGLLEPEDTIYVNKNKKRMLALLNSKFVSKRTRYIECNGVIKKVKIPSNFSKITDTLYASGIVNSSHKPFLDSMEINVVINLMERCRSSLENVYHFPIPDQGITSKKVVNEIIDIIDRPGNITVVHCLGGKGRTAMIFYAYLIQRKDMTITLIDQKYRNSREILMTDPQLTFLKSFERTSGFKFPKAFILVGLPGSGKSTFSEHLRLYIPNMVYINQDILGRKEVTRLVSKHCKDSSFVVIDRCNLTKADRKEWLSYFTDPVWCIQFKILPEECYYRIEHRKNHPTLQGKGGISVVKMLLSKYEPVDNNEGFERIIDIESETFLNYVLTSWKMAPIEISNLFKFPRTRHLYNLGVASRDDLIMSSKEQSEFLNHDNLVVEEKIDGANLGISIEGYTILFQNRSHYVTSKYHRQFEQLNAWRDKHATELFTILRPGYILFGEWLYLQHSILYTKLPDYFIAFDLYDSKERKFFSRSRLEALLAETTIPLVKCITTTQQGSLNDLVELTNTKSEYCDGIVEGVYIKCNDEQWVTRRGKIVRKDFITGNKFWDSGKVAKNIKFI